MVANPVEQSTFPFLAAPARGDRGPGPQAVPRATEPRSGVRRPALRARASPRPVHVTIRWHARVAAPLEPLWRDALEAGVRAGIAAVSGRESFHVFHAAARPEGAVLMVQACSPDALRDGLRTFGEAVTRRANRAVRRIGPILDEEHVVQALPAAAEFSEALRRLLGVRGGGR